MRVLLYQGKTLMAWLIRFQTRSVYSHAAVEFDDGSVIEAMYKGVVSADDFRSNHRPGIKVDAFKILGEDFSPDEATLFALLQVGKDYDFMGNIRFLTRRRHRDDDKWFCSELTEAIVEAGGVQMLRGPQSHHSPRDTGMSPVLEFDEQLTV